MLQDWIPKLALRIRWTPPGKGKRGKLKTTWRKTVEMKLKKFGFDSGGGTILGNR